jgi:hypothetical protein
MRDTAGFSGFFASLSPDSRRRCLERCEASSPTIAGIFLGRGQKDGWLFHHLLFKIT